MHLRSRIRAPPPGVHARATPRRARSLLRARAKPAPESIDDDDVDVGKLDLDVGRRSSLLLLLSALSSSLPAAAQVDPAISSTAAAAATNLDVGALAVKSLKSRVSSGVGSFLRDRQRADGGARLLAPVRNARRRLRDAAAMLLAALDGAEPSAVARAADREGEGGEGNRGGSGDEGHEAALSGRLYGGDGRRRGASTGSNGGTRSSRSSDRVRSIFKSGVKGDKSKTRTPDGLPVPAAFRPILQAVRAGSGECFQFDALDGALPLPQSLVGGAGAANCTLSLVARNAVATLPRSTRGSALARATLDESEAAIGAIRLVDDLLERAAEGDRAAADGVAAALERALRSVAALEGLVAACLNYDGETPTSDYRE